MELLCLNIGAFTKKRIVSNTNLLNWVITQLTEALSSRKRVYSVLLEVTFFLLLFLLTLLIFHTNEFKILALSLSLSSLFSWNLSHLFLSVSLFSLFLWNLLIFYISWSKYIEHCTCEGTSPEKFCAKHMEGIFWLI